MSISYKISQYDGAEEVLTLIDAKKQLRVEHDHEDAEITAFIKAAVSEVENYIGAPILQRTVVFGLSCWRLRVDFPTGPVTAITAVKYRKPTGTALTTLDPENYDLYDFGVSHQQLILRTAAHSISLKEESLDAVQITTLAGWEVDNIPSDIISAVKLIMTDLYEFRGDKEMKMNRSSRDLLRPYKRF